MKQIMLVLIIILNFIDWRHGLVGVWIDELFSANCTHLIAIGSQIYTHHLLSPNMISTFVLMLLVIVSLTGDMVKACSVGVWIDELVTYSVNCTHLIAIGLSILHTLYLKLQI